MSLGPQLLRPQWGKRLGESALVTVPLLFIVVFLAVPLIQILLMSWDSGASGTGGLANFVDKINDPAVRTSLVRTFKASCVIVVLCLLLAYPLAVILTTTGSNLVRSMIIFAVVAQLFVSVVVSSFGWVILLSPTGPVQDILGVAGSESVQLLYNSGAAIAGMVQILLPFMLLPIWSSLRGLDKDLLAAARLLGAKEVSIFGRIMLPLSVPGVFAGIAVVFAASMSGYVTPLLLGGPVDGLWTSVLITNDVLAYNDRQSAATTSVIYLLLLAVSLLLIGAVERRILRYRVEK
jgi:putative spermidine/putrescine transport system permease protein